MCMAIGPVTKALRTCILLQLSIYRRHRTNTMCYGKKHQHDKGQYVCQCYGVNVCKLILIMLDSWSALLSLFRFHTLLDMFRLVSDFWFTRQSICRVLYSGYRGRDVKSSDHCRRWKWHTQHDIMDDTAVWCCQYRFRILWHVATPPYDI